MNTLTIAEQFYSIQGEGVTMGVPAYFLRLTGCNLLCGGPKTDKDGLLHDGATWRCDTIEVWRKGQAKDFITIMNSFQVDPDMVAGQLREGLAHLVITGGEPMLQQRAVTEFIKWLSSKNIHPYIEIETNGTVLPSKEFPGVSQWNVSPKLKNSGMDERLRRNDAMMKWLVQPKIRSVFKFVVRGLSDVEEVFADWIARYDINPKRVYLMPGADTRDELLSIGPEIAELSKQFGFRFSSRLHLALWDKKTGV